MNTPDFGSVMPDTDGRRYGIDIWHMNHRRPARDWLMRPTSENVAAIVFAAARWEFEIMSFEANVVAKFSFTGAGIGVGRGVGRGRVMPGPRGTAAGPSVPPRRGRSTHTNEVEGQPGATELGDNWFRARVTVPFSVDDVDWTAGWLSAAGVAALRHGGTAFVLDAYQLGRGQHLFQADVELFTGQGQMAPQAQIYSVQGVFRLSEPAKMIQDVYPETWRSRVRDASSTAR